jgi:hypothetical protein
MSDKTKFTRTYETDETIAVWTYDLDKFKNGPISVDIDPDRKLSNREKYSKKK